MNKLSDKDREYLNALADDELSEVQAREWQERIQREPELKAAYDEIVSVKQKIASLAPDIAIERKYSAANSGIRKWAVAAGVAAIVFTGALTLWLQSAPATAPQGIVAWHKLLSNEEYVVGETDQPLFVSLGQSADVPIPDLTAWRLYLVDHRVVELDAEARQAVFHYRGLRGCRLTLWYGARTDTTSSGATPDGTDNYRRWLAGPTDISIVAGGMDAERFRSIADYVEMLTKISADPDGQTRIATAEGYENAARCSLG
ncbi:hypothetical protein [Hoeflea sp. TYP-13]|uniref:hypothetical protein n=1 Tax=Hoeflea sp. TYP-13 TaxID=3230023 RepID=UPI0034C68904